MNEEYINNITLEYLLNPILYEKINDQKNLFNEDILKDIKFYRRRICQMTKDMCKENYLNNNLQSIFLNYANDIIYYLKQQDEKDIFQSQYDNLILNNDINNICDISNLENIDNLDNDIDNLDNDIDNLLLNIKPKNNNLDNFVKKINITNTEKILPQIKIANIKDPILKKKGVKKVGKKENL